MTTPTPDEVPVQTEIQALIDQGKYAEAEARLAQLERDRVVSIKATVTTSNFPSENGSCRASATIVRATPLLAAWASISAQKSEAMTSQSGH